MSKRMKAKRFSETFYQHDLVLVPTRKLARGGEGWWPQTNV